MAKIDEYYPSLNKRSFRLITLIFAGLWLASCYHPPYNNFKPYHRSPSDAAKGAAVGAVVGAVTGSTLSSAGIGAGIGAGIFTLRGLAKNSRDNTIRDLKKLQIAFLRYGDLRTLVIPTDRYFLFNSKEFDKAYYPGLAKTIQLLRSYPADTRFYIAGFTDDIGSIRHRKWLTQARAETMLTFLWANGIKNSHLNAQGYASLYEVSSNKIIHGSAQNRRIEIQWKEINRGDPLMQKGNCCITAEK